MYFNEHGLYAKNLDELTNEFALKAGTGYWINLLGDGTNWSATVNQTEVLPGNYLLASDGTIYFSQRTPVTSNDVVLCSNWRSK